MMRFKIFLISFLILFTLSLTTGLPAVFYTHTVSTSNYGTAEIHGIEPVALLINLASVILIAGAVTLSWVYFKNQLATVEKRK